MSVFRSNPNGSKREERMPPPAPPPPRFGEPLPQSDFVPSAETPAVMPPEEPRATFNSFERETRTPTPAEKCANVIAAGSRWSGSLNIDDSVRVEGQLNGEINAKGTVHIAEGSRVEAKIRAAFVVVSGSFKGEVRCEERIELLPKSRFEGDIVTKSLNVHEGAQIDGSIQMSTATKAAPAPERPREESPEPAPARREARPEKAAT